MRIGVGLSIPELSTRGGRFSPASLFTGGVQGAWYDPSDYSTLFQDSAGTTPVTAVEQPVGLMLDKSQGLVLGPELVSNGTFDSGTTGWTVAGTGTFTASGGVATFTRGALGDNASTPVTCVVGRFYRITATVTSASGVGGRIVFNAAPVGSATTGTVADAAAPGTYTAIIPATATTMYLSLASTGNGVPVSYDNISVKELPGNHASQATAASRPVLRARYNLLTYSEQFDNAAWSKGATTVSANQTTAPDGTSTADKLLETITSDVHQVYVATTYVSGGTYSWSVYAKAAERSWFWLDAHDGSNRRTFFNLSNGTIGTSAAGNTATITDVGNGWYRLTVSRSAGTTSGYFACGPTTADNTTIYAGSTTSGVFIWGADLRTGSSAGTYQRIAAATDYATAGFLPYLALDGTDDFVASSAINFSTTDKMTLCTGITKNSDALRAVFAHLGNTATATFRAEAPDASLTTFTFFSTGSAAIQGAAANVAAPATRVFTGIADIAADINLLRLNGTQVASNTADQGTGNYSNSALNVGRRGDNSLFFNGRIYQMVVCGKTLSAAELASTEAYVNQKTGAY